jgi:hypothetical protein
MSNRGCGFFCIHFGYHRSRNGFVWSVYRYMAMPEFDVSLLALVGISSGIYIGFKFTEKGKTGDGSTDGATAGAPTFGAG